MDDAIVKELTALRAKMAALEQLVLDDLSLRWDVAAVEAWADMVMLRNEGVETPHEPTRAAFGEAFDRIALLLRARVRNRTT